MFGMILLGLLISGAVFTGLQHRSGLLPLVLPLPEDRFAFAEGNERLPLDRQSSLKSLLLDRRFLFDVCLAAGMALISATAAGRSHWAPEVVGTPAMAAYWSVLLCIPLLARRVAPLQSAFAVAFVASAHLAAGYPVISPADGAILLSLYAVCAYGPRWASRWALGFALLGAAAAAYTIYAMTTGGPTEPADPREVLLLGVVGGALLLAAWALGLMRRARYDTVTALRRRAAALEDRTRLLEIERDQQAMIATQAERARIAREMHDIVAHSLSIMIVQADGGRYAAATNSEMAGQALATISETGRQALAEMRRLLGILRADDAGAAPELRPMPGNLNSAPHSTPLSRSEGGVPASTPSPSSCAEGGAAASISTPSSRLDDGAAASIPTPSSCAEGGVPVPASSPSSCAEGGAAAPPVVAGSLEPIRDSDKDPANLRELFRQGISVGMSLEINITGEPQELEPGAALTLHRICQEALTNVRKHAGPNAHVKVNLDWHNNYVRLTVTDNGQGKTTDADHKPGFGLIGLRERAALVNGTVISEPLPTGGWQTQFEMPI